jgi:hypothetical protein
MVFVLTTRGASMNPRAAMLDSSCQVNLPMSSLSWTWRNGLLRGDKKVDFGFDSIILIYG